MVIQKNKKKKCLGEKRGARQMIHNQKSERVDENQKLGL